MNFNFPREMKHPPFQEASRLIASAILWTCTGYADADTFLPGALDGFSESVTILKRLCERFRASCTLLSDFASRR